MEEVGYGPLKKYLKDNIDLGSFENSYIVEDFMAVQKMKEICKIHNKIPPNLIVTKFDVERYKEVDIVLPNLDPDCPAVVANMIIDYQSTGKEDEQVSYLTAI